MCVTFPIGRDRTVVSTLRCGRNNPGSNPGHGQMRVLFHAEHFLAKKYNKTLCVVSISLTEI